MCPHVQDTPPRANCLKLLHRLIKRSASDCQHVHVMCAIADGSAVTADAEIDALMEDVGEPSVSLQEQSAAEDSPQQGKTKKKKKKRATDTEDIDALLAQLDGPADQKAEASPEAAQTEAAAAAVEPAAEAGKSKKKKKKGKVGAKDEEDLDAVLAELGMAPAAKPEAERTTDAQAQASEAAPAAEAAAEAVAEAAAEDDEDANVDGDGKVCSACFAS